MIARQILGFVSLLIAIGFAFAAVIFLNLALTGIGILYIAVVADAVAGALACEFAFELLYGKNNG